MDAKRAATAFDQDVEVTAGLRRLDNAEAVGMARHFDVDWIVACNLQKHAGVRAALIGLPRRMLETRPKAKAGGSAGFVADTRAHPGQCLRIRLVALDVGQQRDIVARFCPAVHTAEMTPQVAGQGIVPAELGCVAGIGIKGKTIFAEHRDFCRQAMRPLVVLC